METIWHRMTTKQLKGVSLNDLVGGGDPEAVGRSSREVLQRLGVLTRQSKVLDIGCGCGRTAAALASYLQPSAQYVGVDIIPGLVDFCQLEIASLHGNFAFYTVRQQNPQYSAFIDPNDTTPCLPSMESLANDFDLVVAFSVFTHLDSSETASMLNTIWRRLSDDGTAVLSFFILNPFSRASIALGRSSVFQTVRDIMGKIVIDTFNGPNSAVGFNESTLLDIILESQFQRPLSIHFGHWSGAPGLHYQDLVVLRKEQPLPADFDPAAYLMANADVRNAGMNPFLHYREFGRREGRRLRP